MRRFFLVLAVMISGLGCSQCDSLELELIGLNPTCFGFCDGNVDAIVSGSHGPFSIVQLNEDGLIMPYTPLAYEHCAGWYFVTATDSLGCIQEDSILLVEPAKITIEAIITEPGLPPTCDGSILIDTVYGYQGDYSSIGYYWSSGLSGIGENEATDLCNDFYSLTINDEFGCSSTADFALGYASIEQHDNLSIDLFPNPTINYLNLSISAGSSARAQIQLIDLSGRIVSLLFNGDISPGENNFSFDLSDVEAGNYFLSIEIEEQERIIEKVVIQ